MDTPKPKTTSEELPEVLSAFLEMATPPEGQGNDRFKLNRSILLIIAPYIVYFLAFYESIYISWVLHVYSLIAASFQILLISKLKEHMVHILNPFDFVTVELLNFINVVVFFGLAYFFISDVLIDQFNSINNNPFDYIYFSFVTITTLGYGDIYPVSWYVKLLVIVELCFGLWFIITVIPVAVADQSEKMRTYRIRRKKFDLKLKEAIKNGSVKPSKESDS